MRLTLLTLSIVFASIVNAQDFRFGLYGAPAFNFVSTDHSGADNDSRLFFNFGFISEFGLSERYTIASGLDFMQRGGDLIINDTLGQYRSNFIQVPITLKMRTQEYGRMSYFGRFGVSLGVETNERTEITPEFSRDEDLESFVGFLNANLNIGGGMEYNIGGKSRLLAELLYGGAMFNNLNDNDPRLDDKYKYRFNSIELRLGIIF